MNDLARVIFESLYRMDCEATTIRDGYTTGLYWYGPHAEPDRKNPKQERNWVRRLSELLAEQGIKSERELSYPDAPRTKCDLVIRTGESFWIEAKGAYKEYWVAKGNDSIYRSYLLHPLGGETRVGRSHSAAMDLKKVSTLCRPKAERIGVLLIGFDAPSCPMDEDVCLLSRLAGVDRLPWVTHFVGWDDPHRPGKTVKCWLMERAAPDKMGSDAPGGAGG